MAALERDVAIAFGGDLALQGPLGARDAEAVFNAPAITATPEGTPKEINAGS